MIALDPNRVDWEDEPDLLDAEEDTQDPFAETADKPAPVKSSRKFEHVEDWMNKYFLRIFRRRLNPQPGKGLSWDPRWWLYPEVVARLISLWDAWEEAVAAGGGAMSRWFVNDLEPQLRVLLDGETGPMSHASSARDFSGHPAMPADQMPRAYRQKLARDPKVSA